MTFSLTYAEPYTFPDYYSILGVTEKASQEDIALAYQRQAILYHPDNRNSTNTISEEERALRFQQLGDAFYVLNDSDRRRAYDKARQRGNHPERWRNAHTDPGQVFADAYDELMRPAVENPGYVWSTMGAGSGATLGFIVANIPGIVVGAYIGSILGKIRDMKGKSVYTMFKELDDHHRQAIIDNILNSVQSNIKSKSLFH